MPEDAAPTLPVRPITDADLLDDRFLSGTFFAQYFHDEELAAYRIGDVVTGILEANLPFSVRMDLRGYSQAKYTLLRRWVGSNLTGAWRDRFEDSTRMTVFHFQNEEDAIMFRLWNS